MLGVALEFKNFPDTTTPINNTNLNNMQKLLVDLVHPVGTYYETSNSEFDPNEKWGGTWELETDGTTLVSKSSASSSKFNAGIGTVVGEEEHILTINQIPSHTHAVNLSGGSSGENHLITSSWSWSTENQQNNGLLNLTGGGKAHNNVQPSKICYRWHRTA